MAQNLTVDTLDDAVQACNEQRFDDSRGDLDCAPAWSGAAKKDSATGEACKFMCTLPEAVAVCCALPLHLHKHLRSQMLPGWRVALEEHGEHLTKTISIGGRYKTLRALPVAQALNVIEALKADAVARLREELRVLQQALDSMPAAVEAAAPGSQQISDVASDDVASDDDLELA